jgi:hypothetical protein
MNGEVNVVFREESHQQGRLVNVVTASTEMLWKVLGAL